MMQSDGFDPEVDDLIDVMLSYNVDEDEARAILAAAQGLLPSDIRLVDAETGREEDITSDPIPVTETEVKFNAVRQRTNRRTRMVT